MHVWPIGGWGWRREVGARGSCTHELGGRISEELPALGRREPPEAEPGRHEAQFRLWLWLVSIHAFLFWKLNL